MENITNKLIIIDQVIKNKSVKIFADDMMYTGGWPWNRITYIYDITNFKLLSFIISEFLPYFFLFILILQFSVYFRKYTTNKLYKILQTHSIYYFWVCLLVFSTINVLCLQPSPLIDFSNGVYFWGGYYIINFTTQFTKLCSYVIWGFLLFYLPNAKVYNIKRECIDVEAPILYFLILSLCTTIISVNNIGLFIIVLEAISLLLYVITLMSRTFGSIDGAIQYFIFGSLASVSIFWGLINIFAKYYSLNLLTWFYVFSNSIELIVNYDIGWYFGFIILGLIIKLGCAPFYIWVIEVYSNISFYWLAVFAIYIKFIIAVLLLKFCSFNIIPFLTDAAAALSLIIGCLGTLQQTEIKKFFAYGSIVHVGFLLMSDFNSFRVYLIAYVVSSLAAFFVLLKTNINGQELVYLSDLRILFAQNGTNRFVFTVSLLSLAGIPPFAGFFGKFAVLASLAEDIFLFNDIMSYFLFLISLAVTLIISFYYFRLIVWIYSDLSAEETGKVQSSGYIMVFYTSWVETILCLLTMILFGFIINPLYSIIACLSFI